MSQYLPLKSIVDLDDCLAVLSALFPCCVSWRRSSDTRLQQLKPFIAPRSGDFTFTAFSFTPASIIVIQITALHQLQANKQLIRDILMFFNGFSAFEEFSLQRSYLVDEGHVNLRRL